jgi:hypothetical protein
MPATDRVGSNGRNSGGARFEYRSGHRPFFGREFLKGFFTKNETPVFEKCLMAVKSNSQLFIPGSVHNGF